tara:strand:- start:1670 stop:1915 length:246 start_codon:yes stop_codon:yes gene_type:complete
MKFFKTFEQFSINEKEMKRSDGYVPGTLKREYEGMAEDAPVSIDALSYSQAASDDLVICFVNDEMIRIPKSKLNLEEGEGV